MNLANSLAIEVGKLRGAFNRLTTEAFGAGQVAGVPFDSAGYLFQRQMSLFSNFAEG